MGISFTLRVECSCLLLKRQDLGPLCVFGSLHSPSYSLSRQAGTHG
uniref:Uncharacterized protein n=1 Tax=Anguilla anguilla TaxID=7936 RepID=A0A0E9SZH3_ANGAN